MYESGTWESAIWESENADFMYDCIQIVGN